MTRRDPRWNLGGVALFAATAVPRCASTNASLQANAGINACAGITAFPLYTSGAILLIRGKRIPRTWSLWRGDRRRRRDSQHA